MKRSLSKNVDKARDFISDVSAKIIAAFDNFDANTIEGTNKQLSGDAFFGEGGIVRPTGTTAQYATMTNADGMITLLGRAAPGKLESSALDAAKSLNKIYFITKEMKSVDKLGASDTENITPEIGNDTINSEVKYGDKFDLSTGKPVPIGTIYTILKPEGDTTKEFSNHGIMP